MTNVRQNGVSFEAKIAQSSIHCFGESFTPHTDMNGVILDGRVDGRAVSFSDELCNWAGLASNQDPDRVEGTLRCSMRGIPTGQGTWLWQKRGPLSSTPELTGDWTLLLTTLEVGDYAGTDCPLGTDLHLDQSGNELTGQLSNSGVDCGISAGFADLGAVLTGGVNGTDHRSVRLTSDRCEYIGVLAGNPPYGVTGAVTCIVPLVQFDTTVVTAGPFRLRRTNLP
jgi:hypothetical protein